MALAAQVQKADDVISGLWRGAGAIPVADASADHTMEAIDQDQYDELRSKGLVYAGTHARWKWNNSTLEEQTDARIKVQFSDTYSNDPIPIGTVLRQVGDSNLEIDVIVMSDASTADATFNGDIKLRVSDGRWVRFVITNGYGLLTIVADKSKEFSIDDQVDYNVLNSLKCKVIENAIL